MHWVQMVPECPGCGFVFTRAPGQWLGSWFLNVCLAQTVVFAVLAIGVGFTWPDPPIKAIAVLAVVAASVLPLAFFPYSRTLWVAIDLVMTPLAFDDGVLPGFMLEEDYEAFRREKEPPGPDL